MNQINPEKLDGILEQINFNLLMLLVIDELFQQTGISFTILVLAFENITIEDNEVISTKNLMMKHSLTIH